MKCSKARKLLVRLDDGELDGRTAGEVRQHVAGCRECSRELELLRRSLEAAKEMDPAARLSEVSLLRSARQMDFNGKLRPLPKVFLGLSLMTRFHKKAVASVGVCLLGAILFVVFYYPGSDSGLRVAELPPPERGLTSESGSASGVLALIDLLARPTEVVPEPVPLYVESDQAAIRAAIELASARAYVTIMDLPGEGCKKYREIVEQYPGTEAAETARRELSMIGRMES